MHANPNENANLLTRLSKRRALIEKVSRCTNPGGVHDKRSHGNHREPDFVLREHA